MLIRQPFAIGGSGSTYVYGYVDATFKEGMTKDECINFCTNSEYLSVNAAGLEFTKKNYFSVRKVPQKLPFPATLNFLQKLKISIYFVLLHFNPLPFTVHLKCGSYTEFNRSYFSVGPLLPEI